MKIAFRRQALRDLENVYLHLVGTSPQVADGFLAAIREELSLLASHPFLGRRRHFEHLGLRSWRVRGYEKFLVFYRPTDRQVEIIRILHGARDIAELL